MRASLQEVLDAFETALDLKFEDLGYLGKTRYSIQVTLRSFKLDILVAPNMLPRGAVTARPAWAQQRALFQALVDADFDAVRPYSCAFAESTVAFFKQQSAFVLTSVRLCKLWSRYPAYACLHRIGVSNV